MVFCNDVDLLYWEPDLPAQAALASQTLAAGAGDVAGTTFTATAGPSFVSQKVEAGQIIVLSGSLAGCFPITAVTDATHLQISLLYDDLFPDSGSPPVDVSVGSATGASFVIRTFWAQRKVVSDLILQAIGITPGTADGDATAVLNPQALRRACALGTLQMIYSALAAAASDPASFSVRADLYERLYRRTLRSVQVDLDLNKDGIADTRRSLGLLQLVRK